MAHQAVINFYQSSFDAIRFEKDLHKRASLIRDCAAWACRNSHEFTIHADHPYVEEIKRGFAGKYLNVLPGVPTPTEYLAMAQESIARRARGVSVLAAQ